MEKKMKNESVNTSNRSALNAAASGAKREVKQVGVMFYVNQLNKLARKNEYVDGVNLLQLGKMVQEYSRQKQLFTARVFHQDYSGRPCTIAAYKGNVTVAAVTAATSHGEVIADEGRELILAKDGDGVAMLRPIALSLSGLIAAYQIVLRPWMAAKDRQQREADKAAKVEQRREAAQTRTALRAALREEQKRAKSDYLNGRIDAATFAAVMTKTA